MSETKKRRRLLLPLLASTGLLTTAGAGVWQALAPPEESAEAEQTTTPSDGGQPRLLSSAAASWAADDRARGAEATADTVDTVEAGPPPSEPRLLSSLPAAQAEPLANAYGVRQVAYDEPATLGGEDRYQVQPLPLRAEPASDALRGGAAAFNGPSPAPLTPPDAANPLRGSAEPSGVTPSAFDAAEDEAARRAFGEVLAADAQTTNGQPTNAQPTAAQPTAAEAFDAAGTLSQPAALAEPMHGFLPGDAAVAEAFADSPANLAAPVEDAATPPSAFPGGGPGNELRQPAETTDLRDAFAAQAPAASGAEPPLPAPRPMQSPFAQPTDAQPTDVQPPNTEPLNAQPPQQFVELAPQPQPGYGTASPTPPLGNEPRMAAAAPRREQAGGEGPTGFSASGGLGAAGVVGGGRPGDRSLEGRQQPSIAIQKFAPAEVQIGKPCRFITKVRNMGQRPAVGVVVQDQTPAGARLLSTTPQAQTSGDQIRWSLGALAPGEERTLEMELSPVEEGEIGSVATVSFATQATARARCTRPQLAVRMTAPSRVLVGRQQRVSIELHNPGTGDATGVMLLENVPENLRHEAGAALEFEVGTLRAGETRTMELVMSAEKPGRVVNVLTARADGNLQVQQQVEFDVVAPDLAVGLQGPRRRYLERPATYTVSIENPGTAPAKDVRLVTRLPQGMRFIEANNFGEYDAASHSVYWSLAELPEGQKGAVQLTAMPVTSGELELEVEGQASEGLKDQDAMRVQIEGLAALNFEVIDVEDPIEVGGSTVYEVRVTNQGTKAATNVGVRVQIPAGMQAVKASGDTRNSVQNGAVVFAPLDRLPPQAEATFRVQVEGVQPGDQRVAVEVSSDDLAQPVRKEESTRVFGDE